MKQLTLTTIKEEKKMRRYLRKKGVTIILFSLLALFIGMGSYGIAQATEDKKRDALIEILIRKGILTEQEAGEIEAQVEKESAEATKKKGTELTWRWKNGLNFGSDDKAFKFKLGGRIMSDFAFMTEDDPIKPLVGDGKDVTSEFRRARFYLSGTIYDKIIFKAQYDFAGGDADVKDLYIGMQKLPGVGTLKIGHFKEPFGLEELTSSKYITFMERSLPAVFTPGRNTGIGVFKEEFEGRLTWALGAFLDANDYGDEGGQEDSVSVTGRITALPWFEGKEKLLHLGLAYSWRDATDKDLRFRERPESHLTANRFVDTGTFAADSEHRLGIEAALVCGPFSLQGEYMFSDVDGLAGGPEPSFDGYYGYASYFITGEHRSYKKGAFSRVKPKSNFLDEGGAGAWEIAARYSSLDLTDEGIAGGELDDITVGLNWYLNPNVRVMWNYVNADLDDVGDADIFQMRFQIDF